jgi:hypothetical protein
VQSTKYTLGVSALKRRFCDNGTESSPFGGKETRREGAAGVKWSLMKHKYPTTNGRYPKVHFAGRCPRHLAATPLLID